MPGQLHPSHCVVRLVSYREGEAWRCGILDGDEVADAAGVAAAAGVSEDCSSTRAVLTGGERILEALASRVGEVEPTSVSELALGPPSPIRRRSSASVSTTGITPRRWGRRRRRLAVVIGRRCRFGERGAGPGLRRRGNAI